MSIHINMDTTSMTNMGCTECTNQSICLKCKQTDPHEFCCLKGVFVGKQLADNEKISICDKCLQYKCKTTHCYNVQARITEDYMDNTDSSSSLAQIDDDDYVEYCETCLQTKCVTCYFNDRDESNTLSLCKECMAVKCSVPDCKYPTFGSNEYSLCFKCKKSRELIEPMDLMSNSSEFDE